MRSLARREAVFLTEGLDESLGAFVLQRPVPVGGAEDTLHVLTGTLCHQTRIQRNDDHEVLAVDLLVAQTELNSLGQGVHHVLAIVVQNKNVSTGVQNRRDVLREVTSAKRRTNSSCCLPAHAFGVLLDGFFLRPAPGVVAVR